MPLGKGLLYDAPGRAKILAPGPYQPQPPVAIGLVTGGTIQTGISGVNAQGGGGINNTEEYNVSWYDQTGRGWRIGMIPGYGGALLSTWYEINAFKLGLNQTYMGTTNPDDLYHWFSQDASFNFSGTENAPYTTGFKELPGGSYEHRYYDSGNIVQPVAGVSGAALTWRVRHYIQPGDPGMIFVRMDVTNPSGSTVALNTTASIESDWPAGLTTALQNGATAWISGNGFVNTVGGTATGWGSEGAIDPDGSWITPVASTGLTMGVLVARKNSLLQIAGSSNAQTTFTTSGPPGRLKNATTIDIAAGTFPARTTYTFYLLVGLRRNLTTAEANSMIADYLTPDTGSVVSIGVPGPTFYSYDEGRYQITAAPTNIVQLQHTISGNVTERWNPAYKISNWSDSSGFVSVSIGGASLSQNSDYIANVDVANQVLYLKLMRPIVTSGATGNQLNNGLILISGGMLPPQLPWKQPIVDLRTLRRFRPFVAAAQSGSANNNWFATISDTVGAAADSVVRLFTGARNPSETIGPGADAAPGRVLGAPRAASDTVGPAADTTPVRALAGTRAPSDTVGPAADSPVRQGAFARSDTENVGPAADAAPTGTKTIMRSPSDTVGPAADSAPVRAFAGTRAPSDTIGPASDSATRQGTFGRAPSDTVGPASDVVSRLGHFFRAISETVGPASDAVQATKQKVANLIESVGPATDAIVRLFTGARTTTDTVGPASDSPAGAHGTTRSLSDSVGPASDSAARQWTGTRAPSDTIGPAADAAPSKTIGFARTPSESVGPASDSPVRSFTGFRSVLDALGAAIDAVLAVLRGSKTPGTVGAYDRLVYSVGIHDSAVSTAGAADTLADTVGAHDVAVETTGTHDQLADTSGGQSWP